MSSWSATASSSSSQSSKLSWQPSQEANFHTARRGRTRRAKSNLPCAEKRGDAVEAKNWPVAADKGGSELAMPAQPDSAFHVTLHRDKDPFHSQPALTQRIDGEPHHDLRPAHHCHGMVRIDRRARDQRWYNADVAPPIGCGMVDRDRNVEIETPPPRFEFSPVEDVSRTPRAVEHNDPFVTLAMGEQVIDHRAQRCEAEPTRYDDDVAAFALGDGPARAVWSAHTNDLITAQPGDRATDGADRPHRMHNPVVSGRISADTDCHFAQAEDVQHVELPRGEGEGRGGGQLEGCHVRRVAPDPRDAQELRHKAVGRQRAAVASAITSV